MDKKTSVILICNHWRIRILAEEKYKKSDKYHKLIENLFNSFFIAKILQFTENE